MRYGVIEEELVGYAEELEKFDINLGKVLDKFQRR